MSSMFRRNRRGRPPHPDVLTPAEWRVLEELRKGRTNAEIGAELRISSNTVKTHVSRMLDKLTLADRQALAAWDGRPAAPVESYPRRPFAIFAGWGAVKSAGIVLATAAVAIVGGIVVALAVAQLGDPDEAPAAAPMVEEPAVPGTPTATPTPQSTPTPTPTPEVRPPGTLAQRFVDAGHSLLLLDGCVSCDGPPSRVIHLDLRAQSETVLIERDTSGATSPYLSSALRARDGAIYLAECFDGYCGGLDAATPGARTVISRLGVDGALTPVLEAEGGASLIAVTGEDRFLGLAYVRAVPELRWLDTGEFVDVPEWSDRRGWHTPLLLADGGLVWEDGPRLRWTDGSTFLDATECDHAADGRDRIVDFVEDGGGARFAVLTRDQWSNPTRAALAIFERDGDVAHCVHSVRVSTQISIRLWVEPDLLVGVSPSSGWGSSTRPALVSLPDGDAELLPYPVDSPSVGISVIALLSD